MNPPLICVTCETVFVNEANAVLKNGTGEVKKGAAPAATAKVNCAAAFGVKVPPPAGDVDTVPEIRLPVAKVTSLFAVSVGLSNPSKPKLAVPL